MSAPVARPELPSPADIAKRVRDMRADIARLEQMMDVELDPGSDLYRELRSFLNKLRDAVVK